MKGKGEKGKGNKEGGHQRIKRTEVKINERIEKRKR